MACDILAIPISTISSEPIFNAGTRVLNPYRASLSKEMMQVLICKEDWVRRLHRIKQQLKSHVSYIFFILFLFVLYHICLINTFISFSSYIGR